MLHWRISCFNPNKGKINTNNDFPNSCVSGAHHETGGDDAYQAGDTGMQLPPPYEVVADKLGKPPSYEDVVKDDSFTALNTSRTAY